MVREVTLSILKGLGYEALGFKEPAEYLNYVNSQTFEKPAALFTNLDFPVANKHAMMGHLSSILPKSVFIIMSDMPHIHSDSLISNHLFLKKPFNMQAVANVVAGLK